mmetsp:Transcript_47940/g.147933  ORF Transcript_47940/g.147933 Transcript_47940/m.147933 type:complete len:303 (+) Transcript_47940:1700-2608(+)
MRHARSHDAFTATCTHATYMRWAMCAVGTGTTPTGASETNEPLRRNMCWRIGDRYSSSATLVDGVAAAWAAAVALARPMRTNAASSVCASTPQFCPSAHARSAIDSAGYEIEWNTVSGSLLGTGASTRTERGGALKRSMRRRASIVCGEQVAAPEAASARMRRKDSCSHIASTTAPTARTALKSCVSVGIAQSRAGPVTARSKVAVAPPAGGRGGSSIHDTGWRCSTTAAAATVAASHCTMAGTFEVTSPSWLVGWLGAARLRVMPMAAADSASKNFGIRVRRREEGGKGFGRKPCRLVGVY